MAPERGATRSEGSFAFFSFGSAAVPHRCVPPHRDAQDRSLCVLGLLQACPRRQAGLPTNVVRQIYREDRQPTRLTLQLYLREKTSVKRGRSKVKYQRWKPELTRRVLTVDLCPN